MTYLTIFSHLQYKDTSKIIGGVYKEIITRRNGSSYFKKFTLALEAKRDYCITAK